MDEKVTYKESIDWEYFRSLPIEDVASSLGLEPDRYGKIICPCHDDHHPSMILGSKTNEKRKNSCWCPVCNEGGSPLDLVLAKNYGLKPSDVRKDKSRYNEELLGAAHYLDDLFPGGIIRTAEAQNNRGINEPIPPNIPWHIIKEIGLKQNPLTSQSEEMIELSKTDRAELLLDKLLEREQSLWQYAVNVVNNFPKLDAKATAAIFNQAREWIAEIYPYREAVRVYYFAISDYEFSDVTFVDELEDEASEELKDDVAEEYA